MVMVPRNDPHLWSPAVLPPHSLHHGAIKLEVATAQPTSFHTISHRLLASFPMAEKVKREQRNISEITVKVKFLKIKSKGEILEQRTFTNTRK
jgi:hypothetical protein